MIFTQILESNCFAKNAALNNLKMFGLKVKYEAVVALQIHLIASYKLLKETNKKIYTF